MGCLIKIKVISVVEKTRLVCDYVMPYSGIHKATVPTLHGSKFLSSKTLRLSNCTYHWLTSARLPSLWRNYNPTQPLAAASANLEKIELCQKPDVSHALPE